MHWITCIARIQIGYIKSKVSLNYFMDISIEIVVR
jgi:hypothetical protein